MVITTVWVIAIAGYIILTIYFCITWLLIGREPRPKTTIPEYTPPNELSGSEMRYLLQRGFDHTCLTSELIELAAQHAVQLEHTADHWTMMVPTELNRTQLSVCQQAVLKPVQSGVVYNLTAQVVSSGKDKRVVLAEVVDVMEQSLQAYLVQRFVGEISYHRGWTALGVLIGIVPLGVVCYLSNSTPFILAATTLALPLVALLSQQMIAYSRKHSVVWYCIITIWFIYVLLALPTMVVALVGGVGGSILMRLLKTKIEQAGYDYNFFNTLCTTSAIVGVYSSMMYALRQSFDFDMSAVIIIAPYLLTMTWGGLALHAYTIRGQRLAEHIRGFVMYLRTVEQLPARLDQRDAVMELNAPSLSYLIALDLNPYWSNRLEESIFQSPENQMFPDWKIV